MGEKIFYIVLFSAITIAGFYQFKAKDMKGHKKDLIVYVTIMVVNLTIMIGMLMDVDIPSPLGLITKIYQPISDFVFQGLLN